MSMWNWLNLFKKKSNQSSQAYSDKYRIREDYDYRGSVFYPEINVFGYWRRIEIYDPGRGGFWSSYFFNLEEAQTFLEERIYRDKEAEDRRKKIEETHKTIIHKVK